MRLIELATPALLFIVNTVSALQLDLPSCTGTADPTPEAAGVLCVVDMTLCAGTAFLQEDSKQCGDGEFWESCGALTFNDALHADSEYSQDITIEDCESVANDLRLQAAAELTTETPSAPENASDGVCAGFWDRYVEGIKTACTSYVSTQA